jgi:uncharacterized protein YecE (DUF72 family)
MAVLIGTSGFSYQDWKGKFYPANIRGPEMLPFYARIFPVVELNTTFYGVPKPSVTEQMTQKVPEGFEFVLKAPQEVTHKETASAEIAGQFMEALAPIRDAGMMGCVLAQYPWSFRQTDENRDRLKELSELMPGIPLVVEFRNEGWMRDETYALLTDLGYGFCCVDEPRLKGLLPPVAKATSGIGYVRFHGRNAKQWWKHDAPHQRYDYLYSREELESWVPKVQEVDAAALKTYVFFNNHYEGKSGQNALQLAEMLHLGLGTTLPTTPTQSTLEFE